MYRFSLWSSRCVFCLRTINQNKMLSKPKKIIWTQVDISGISIFRNDVNIDTTTNHCRSFVRIFVGGLKQKSSAKHNNKSHPSSWLLYKTCYYILVLKNAYAKCFFLKEVQYYKKEYQLILGLNLEINILYPPFITTSQTKDFFSFLYLRFI